MTCFHPMRAFQSKHTGAVKVVGKKTWYPQNPLSWEELTIPCGGCIGCRLEHSRQWAVRCLHEASQHESNAFITLTYDEDNLPEYGTLVKRHHQLFMKRLRKKYGSKIKFFHCGEYGEQFGRPHYHTCLFGHDFQDKYLWKVNNDIKLYRSPQLEKLWTYGHSTTGEVTFESAAYVARYIMAKITGEKAKKHYFQYDKHTGEIIHDKIPEYITMSRAEGIGKVWFEKYKTDVYPSDYIIMNGRKMRPPKYYDNLLKNLDEEQLILIKKNREEALAEHDENNTPERLSVREKIQKKKFDQLIRKL